MTSKTYPITRPVLSALADAVCLLDWIKNRLPDECPEKAEAAALAPICHQLIADVLGADEPLVYGKTEQEHAA
jgi:hypothetical protein